MFSPKGTKSAGAGMTFGVGGKKEKEKEKEKEREEEEKECDFGCVFAPSCDLQCELPILQLLWPPIVFQQEEGLFGTIELLFLPSPQRIQYGPVGFDEKVGNVGVVVRNSLNFPEGGQIRFYYGSGRPLDDGKQLRDYGIKDGDVVGIGLFFKLDNIVIIEKNSQEILRGDIEISLFEEFQSVLERIGEKYSIDNILDYKAVFTIMGESRLFETRGSATVQELGILPELGGGELFLR